MLVVDLHTLETVNFLDFIHDIFLDFHRALDGKDIRRGDLAFGKGRAGPDVVVLLCQDLLWWSG